MKPIISLIFIFSTLVCFSQHQNTMQGSDNFLIKKNGSYEKWLEYPNYNVITKSNKQTLGEVIMVFDPKERDTLISIQAGPLYFYGIHDDNLFIDKGTGNIRELTVFDLRSQSFKFSTQYESTPVLKSDSIFYDYPLNLSSEVHENLPNCPDSLKKQNQYGYSEKRIYILNCEKSINTGIIKCVFRE
jgi:hypothetical protein